MALADLKEDADMPDHRLSDNTADLVQAVHTVNAIGNRICNAVGDDAPHLIARVEVMRASLRTMLVHARLALETSRRMRVTDDMSHRDHIREIETADRIMRESSNCRNSQARPPHLRVVSSTAPDKTTLPRKRTCRSPAA